MKWSEFKKQVDDTLGNTGDCDPEILYIDVDDFTVGDIDIANTGIGLIITEEGCQRA